MPRNVTGVAGLTRPDAATEAAKTYALAMADTVLVPEDGAGGELLTSVAPRTWTDNAYFFNVRVLRMVPFCCYLLTSDNAYFFNDVTM